MTVTLSVTRESGRSTCAAETTTDSLTAPSFNFTSTSAAPVAPTVTRFGSARKPDAATSTSYSPAGDRERPEPSVGRCSHGRDDARAVQQEDVSEGDGSILRIDDAALNRLRGRARGCQQKNTAEEREQRDGAESTGSAAETKEHRTPFGV